MKYRLQLGNITTEHDTYGDAMLAARLNYDGQIVCIIDAMPDRAPYTTAAWWDMGAIIRAERAYADIEAAAYELFGDDPGVAEAELLAAWDDVERAYTRAENLEQGIMVDHKTVQDADGFWTDYTLYTDGGERWYTVFGDTDIYGPDSDPDYETDDEQDAYTWFDCYDGLCDGDEDDDTDYTYTLSETDKDAVVAVWTRNTDYTTDGRYYTWTDAAETVWELDREECRIRHRGTGAGCVWTDWKTAI